MSNTFTRVVRKMSASSVIPELARAIRNGQTGYQTALVERLNTGNKGFNAPKIKVVAK
jgi:hypothetical protein